MKKLLTVENFPSILILTGVLKELIEDKTTAWRFRNVQVTGSPIPQQLSKRASEICERFTVRYGTSEMSTVTICVFDENGEFHDYEVGTPSPGAEVKVVDDAGQLAKRGERGELYIRSPVRFLGYLGDREKRREGRAIHPVSRPIPGIPRRSGEEERGASYTSGLPSDSWDTSAIGRKPQQFVRNRAGTKRATMLLSR